MAQKIKGVQNEPNHAQNGGADALKPTRARKKGNGPGWGGPAKGASTSKHPEKNRPPKPLPPGPGRGHFMAAGEDRRARDERHAEELKKLYYDVAMGVVEAEVAMRLSAATHYLNRMEGLPVAKIVTEQSDDLKHKTREEKLAELRELQAKHAAKGSDASRG